MASLKNLQIWPSLMAKLSIEYPNLDNHNLPQLLGCVMSHEKDEAKQAFRRICFKDVRISAVEPIRNNHKPSCVWKIYYDLKDPNTELDDDSDNSSGSTIPSKLPDDQPSLSKLYKDITAMADILGMKVVQKYHTEDRLHAVVEYSPHGCHCPFQDFNQAAEEPRICGLTLQRWN